MHRVRYESNTRWTVPDLDSRSEQAAAAAGRNKNLRWSRTVIQQPLVLWQEVSEALTFCLIAFSVYISLYPSIIVMTEYLCSCYFTKTTLKTFTTYPCGTDGFSLIWWLIETSVWALQSGGIFLFLLLQASKSDIGENHPQHAFSETNQKR